jgi:hypothetical protein
LAGVGGGNNDGNTATATDGGFAVAGSFGTGNDGNTATATDGGTARAGVGTTDFVGGTAIAGATQIVTCPTDCVP